MPTTGDLQSRDSISCTTPQPLPQMSKALPPPLPHPQNDPSHHNYEVLHEVHAIKICFRHCNDEIIYVSD